MTHGHADHARGGHGQVWATPETLAIMGVRYGPQNGVPVAYGEVVNLNGVDVSFVPAGHCLGSAQIVMDFAGERVVVSGDYKRHPDPSCVPFQPVPCDIFVTEATFGLPVFRHPDTGSEIDRLLARLHANPERCVVVGAYGLGKAQRVITELRARGHHAPIYIHGAVERLCGLYEEYGVPLGELRPATGVKKDEMRGHIVICPPAAGVASALGLLLAPARVDQVATVARPLGSFPAAELEERFASLETEARRVIAETLGPGAPVRVEEVR